MKISGTVHIDAGPDAVAALLADPRRLVEALPGVENVTTEDSGGLRVDLSLVTGLGVTRFSAVLGFHGDEGSRRIEIHGAQGQQRIDATVDTELTADGTGTAITYQASVRFGGPVTSLAQHSLRGLVADYLVAVMSTATELVADQR